MTSVASKVNSAENEHRIREEAYRLWEAEGRPAGREEFHWASAKEILALRESHDATLIPLTASTTEVVEPVAAFENQGEMPSLTDQGEAQPGPSWEAAQETADAAPLSTEKRPATRRNRSA
jgi:hypothetical protein